ncbi:MAG: amino acid permease [Candidatus Omnitrophota bacterium]|nr:amino acid permease [Candidatus Omnitrophota bacterium]
MIRAGKKTENTRRLKKVLGFWGIFSIAAGAMISSGLFILPGLAFAKAGPAVIFAYLLAGLFVIPSVLSKTELATAMPSAGGTYFYIERSLGAGAGTFGGLANWFSLSFKSAFALIGLGVFTLLLYPGITGFQIKLLAVFFCLIFTALNVISVKMTGRVQIVLVLILFAILIYYSVKGFTAIDVQKYVPFLPYGTKAVFAAAGLVFISFGGLTKIASVAEEVKKPSLNIPLGMLAAFVVVTFFYVFTVFVTVGLVDKETLSHSLIPLSLGARSFAPLSGKIVIALAAIIAFVTTANAGILSASRSPMAMSRDNLLPGFFGRVNRRFGTPHISIFTTCIFVIIVILFLDLENLVKTASTLMLILFMFVNLSVIIMRESKIQNYRPSFRSPLYPWLQIAAILAYGFLIFEMGRVPLIITAVFIAVCFLWYLFYVSVRTKRRAAIMHIVERITAREMAGSTLGGELREILRERDEIIEDRFDRLIKDAVIIDIGRSVSVNEAFRQIADALSKRLDTGSGDIFRLFKEREELSSTVIQPGMAIPHIIIDANHKFDILLIRCKDGIIFPGAPEPVRTMFVLVGSMDERNYHLRALMAIAQIAQEKDFEKKWLAARNIEELRDVILLSSRKRD